jgi:23S rRNA (adenine2030-N6)-methyltransferase
VNYRHSFHAGNFADLVKHAALTRLLARLTASPEPLLVVDTHAGAGLYDLGEPGQARSKEAEAGVARLGGFDLPAEFDRLAASVRARNPQGEIRLYPGSPALIAEALRPQDRYVACELRPDDHARLAELLATTGKRAEARNADGFAAAPALARSEAGRMLLLIDPPFERADDYVRIVESVSAVLRAKPDAVVLIWLPLKDLETLDGFVRRMEHARLPAATVAETRMRPLHQPMRMNGCVLVAINTPPEFDAELEVVSAFVAEALGEPGGRAKVWSTTAA